MWRRRKERALEALADRVAGDDGLGKNKPKGKDDDEKDVVVYEDSTAAASTVGTRSIESVRGGKVSWRH